MIEIPIVGKPTPAQREAFKAAKAELRVTEPMKFVEASRGCGRALSFGPLPDFACDWVTLVGKEDEDVTEALGWMLRLRTTYRKATVGDWLERSMGRVGVKELHG